MGLIAASEPGRKNQTPGQAKYQQMYDDYMSSIEQYKGTEYYDRLANHGYLQYQAYSPTIWDNIAYAFGDTSAEDRFYQSRFDEVYANRDKILAEMQANAHNSTAAQVARDAAAGINDTLNGETSGNGQQGPTPPDETPPNMYEGSEQTQANMSALASAGVGFCQGIFGMVKGFQELGINIIQQGAASAALSQSAEQLALDTEVANLPSPEKIVNDDGSVSYDYSNIPGYVANRPVPRGLSGVALRAYKYARRNLYDSNGKAGSKLQEAWRKSVENSAKSTENAATSMSMPGFNFDDFGSFASGIGERITKVQLNMMDFDREIKRLDAALKGLEESKRNSVQDSEIDAENAENRARSAEAQYQQDYFEGMDGSVIASQDMADQQLRSIQRDLDMITAEYNKWIQQSRKSLYEFVRGNGKWYNQIGMTLLPGLLQTVDNSSQYIGMAISAMSSRLGIHHSKKL